MESNVLSLYSNWIERLANIDVEKHGLFVVDVEFADDEPRDFEVLASRLLLCNCGFMARIRRPIIKFARIRYRGGSPLSAAENAIRALLTGEYSTFVNIDQWVNHVGKGAEGGLQFERDVSRVVSFIQSLSVEQNALETDKADFFLDVVAAEGDERPGGFERREVGPFATQISIGDVNLIRGWSTGRSVDGVRVHLGEAPPFLCLSGSLNRGAPSADSWWEIVGQVAGSAIDE